MSGKGASTQVHRVQERREKEMYMWPKLRSNLMRCLPHGHYRKVTKERESYGDAHVAEASVEPNAMPATCAL
jgi:hypothetical protein